MDVLSDTVHSLESVPARLDRLYRTMPASYWDWKPASWEACPGEEFSFREHACHMLDFDTLVYHVRIQRTRDESHPRFERVFGNELAAKRRYSEIHPLEAIADFVAARKATVATIKALDDLQLQRKADLAQYGEITLAGLVHLLCDHDSRHLACMHWLLAKLACSGRPI
ncbi:DinB family protein [Rhodanobacter hydrolyticus]|uniref:DinB family protein n=1 Tax=Rhodanobacter hydrolyticus TaxID=2250595 RepID=A0ABW8JB50_9GAMM